MKVLRSWLEEYIDLSHLSDEQVAHAITSHSSEVESIRTVTHYFNKKVVIARIKNLKKHPNADTLSQFEAYIGTSEPLTICTAATNVYEGMYFPLALVGAKLPKATISERSMRGVISKGMGCSKDELLLENTDTDGIWELNGVNETQLGTPIEEVYPDLFPKETVFDIKILPDRLGSIGNYIGLAIELARILRNPMLLKNTAKLVYEGNTSTLLKEINNLKQDELEIDFADTSGLSEIFTLSRVRLTKQYSLPILLSRRLYLTEVHSVNPLTDLSNYIMFDTGQPVHFFSTESIVQRESRKWKISQLSQPTPFSGLGNIKSIEIPADVAVLQDEKGILSIPSVTGGEETKISENDTDILIEFPYFSPTLTSKNTFLLHYRSEGSKIWSSVTDKSRVVIGLYTLYSLLPGKYSIVFTSRDGKQEPIQNFFASIIEARTLAIDWDYISSRIDTRNRVEIHYAYEPIAQLFGVLNDTELRIEIPAYNLIHTQDDLLRELIHISGVDSLKPHHLSVALIPQVTLNTNDYTSIQSYKNFFTQYGYHEIITRVFTEKKNVDVSKALKILSPQNESMDYVRTSLIPSMLIAVSQNIVYTQKLQLFEIAQMTTWNETLHREYELVAAAVHSDIYAITTLVQELSQRLHIPLQYSGNSLEQYGDTESFSAKELDIQIIQVANKIKKAYDLPLSKPILLTRIRMHTLLRIPDTHHYSDVSQYPSIRRDYTFCFSPDLHTSRFLELVQQTRDSSSAIEYDIIPISLLQSEKDTRLTIRIIYTHPTKTLTKDEVAQCEERMIEILQNHEHTITLLD